MLIRLINLFLYRDLKFGFDLNVEDKLFKVNRD